MTAAILLAAAICNAEVCPERTDDFCWENDKFGMRAYGPGDYHKWSGWDVFNKAADAGTTCCHLLHNPGKCGKWHDNPFKGILDNYTMGASRGVGGVAFWGDGEWKTYSNWESAKVIRTDDECCEFELVYPAFAAPGKMTCHVTLRRGERFFRCDVSFEHPDRFQSDFRAGPGIDLEPKRDHKGVLVEEPGLVSLFEDPKGANGSTMEAIFVADAADVEVMTDRMNCRVLAFKKPRFTYWAGAAWSKAEEITTPEAWIAAVRAFRQEKSIAPLALCRANGFVPKSEYLDLVDALPSAAYFRTRPAKPEVDPPRGAPRLLAGDQGAGPARRAPGRAVFVKAPKGKTHRFRTILRPVK